jgi:hypothetical protein
MNSGVEYGSISPSPDPLHFTDRRKVAAVLLLLMMMLMMMV